MLVSMSVTRISKGGQISVPASVRRRWGVARLRMDDRGDHIVLSPLPDDPIAAAEGALPHPGEELDAVRARVRAEDGRAEERRLDRRR